jgi:hypothetical protein
MSAETHSEVDEVERLRARVAELEAEMIEVRAWANEVAGEAQARTYWLDRWHLDLNRLMARRGADRVRAAVRALRAVFRAGRRTKRRLLS